MATRGGRLLVWSLRRDVLLIRRTVSIRHGLTYGTTIPAPGCDCFHGCIGRARGFQGDDYFL